MSSSPSYLDPVVLPLIVGETVLDAGCGYGRWCHLIQSNFWEAGLERPPAVDGFDAFAANVEHCLASGCYRNVWQQALPSPLDGQWDTVLVCELIEHIPEDAVETVLDQLEGAARRRIIVTTPNSPEYRGGSETIVGFNEFEAHLSYVTAGVFRRRGYKVRGAGWGNPRSRIVRAGQKLHLATTLHSVPRAFASLGATLVAVKDM
jgi:2-polyprenyl-3-methyl-5-hydroxy-6-metoxy-1,4-benzoquinol methylase